MEGATSKSAPICLSRDCACTFLPRSALGLMLPKSAALLMPLNGLFSVWEKLRRESFSHLILNSMVNGISRQEEERRLMGMNSEPRILNFILDLDTVLL